MAAGVRLYRKLVWWTRVWYNGLTEGTWFSKKHVEKWLENQQKKMNILSVKMSFVLNYRLVFTIIYTYFVTKKI